jgi:hypothetical protein
MTDLDCTAEPLWAPNVTSLHGNMAEHSRQTVTSKIEHPHFRKDEFPATRQYWHTYGKHVDTGLAQTVGSFATPIASHEQLRKSNFISTGLQGFRFDQLQNQRRMKTWRIATAFSLVYMTSLQSHVCMGRSNIHRRLCTLLDKINFCAPEKAFYENRDFFVGFEVCTAVVMTVPSSGIYGHAVRIRANVSE